MSDRPISRRRAETRERLMDGALGVIAERGVLAASVEEICERAGFTRGAFYSNFASKNDLVLAMFSHHRDQLFATVTRLAESDLIRDAAEHPDRLGELVEAAILSTTPRSRTDRSWMMAIAEMRLYAAREPAIRRSYLEFRRDSHTALLDTIEAMAEVGDWEFALPAEAVIEVLDTMYQSAVLQAVMTDPDGLEPDSAREAFTPFIEVMKAIIRPTGGR